MSDILYDAAVAFSNVIKFDYLYTLGNNKKQVKLSVLSSKKDEFTHIFGIDHLNDSPAVIGKNTRQKIAVYNNILKKKITFSDISNSAELDKYIDSTYNSATNKPYTIRERIISMRNIEYILDNSYKGKLYKWDKDKCNVKKTNGKTRKISINADYLLVVPSENHFNEKYYIFLYQTNKGQYDEPIKLNIFSAFPDCLDLTSGQAHPYTILKAVKYNIKTKTEYELYVKPSYAINCNIKPLP